MDRTIVLLSGGVDSATALYLVKRETGEVYSLNMIYTQAHDSEAEASKKIASVARVKEHFTIYLPFFKDVEKRYRPTPSAEISSAYLPARNLVFYGIAASYAETLNATRIVFGSNADDAKELPDARPEFIGLMNELLRVGTRKGRENSPPQFVNPLINYSKGEVLRLALKLNVPLELTWSCYEDSQTPCGKCRGCLMRRKAFDEVGVHDPLNLNSTKA
ncbi:MAG TPA: 7-cyano-7-deazaguanine synthase [Terriglobales bacterium]|nr:7-cyano-7-deazaguanine synthase [Terriglobales bacterium]